MISTFVVRTWHKQVFSGHGSNKIYTLIFYCQKQETKKKKQKKNICCFYDVVFLGLETHISKSLPG